MPKAGFTPLFAVHNHINVYKQTDKDGPVTSDEMLAHIDKSVRHHQRQIEVLNRLKANVLNQMQAKQAKVIQELADIGSVIG